MEFAAGAALLLRRLASAGHGTLIVHRPAYGDRPAAEVPVTVLAEELTTTARELAARFDARNGTPTQSRWVADRLSLEPIGGYLPLSATAARQAAGPVGSAGRSSAAADPVAPSAATPQRPQSVTPESPQSATPELGTPLPDLPADVPPIRLLELVEERWLRHRQDDHLATALRMFDERFDHDCMEPSVLARRAELRALQRQTVDDPAGAVTASREAIALHRQVPDPVREQIVAGRLGVLLALADDTAEGLSLAQGSADYLAEHGDAVARAGGYDRLSVVLFKLERTTEALEVADRAAAEAAGAGDRHLLARIALRRTRFLDLLGRRGEANEAVRQARDLFLELGSPADYLATACLRYADSIEEPSQAIPAWDEAVRTATEETVLQARSLRARALLLVDRPAEAVDDLVEAVALSVQYGIADGAAHLRWKLAEAYQQAGMSIEAAEAAEEAIGELKRLGRQADADRCRHLLAAVYTALHEYDLALTLLDELATNLDSPDNLAWRGRVLEEAGDLLYRQDRDGLAAQRFAAAATAYRLAERGIDELRSRRREISAQLWAADPDAAVAALDLADRVAATLAPPATTPASPPAGQAVPLGGPAGNGVPATAALRWERALLAEAAARALLAVDRPDEALGRLPGVADDLRSMAALDEAQHVDLLTGELLVRLDRPAEAEKLLRMTLDVVTEHPDLASRGAWWLAEALTALGRDDEAAALRAEYALDSDG
jgi:tetratricopeptide (TPR) repeat protein